MEIIAVIIGVLLSGMTCAIIAERKGRSSIGWFAIGVLFSYIALPLLCVATDVEKQEKEKPKPKECPQCGAENAANARVCRMCKQIL